MSAGTALLAKFAAISAVAASSNATQWQEVIVPVAPPMIVIVGQPAPSPREPERRIVFKRRVAADGRVIRPKDLNELVEMIRSGLPPDYRRDMAAYFGFAPKTGEQNYSMKELRLYDLDVFLASEFGLFDQRTSLGRQVRCMSPGEGSLLPLRALVVRREIADRYERRPGLPVDVNVYASFALAERLAYVCGHRR